MTDGILIYQRLEECTRAKERLSDLLDAYDDALPQAEHDYQTTRYERYLLLLERYGTTTAREIVRGEPEVAELRMCRDRLRCKRQTAGRELVWLTGEQGLIRDEMAREYGRSFNQ